MATRSFLVDVGEFQTPTRNLSQGLVFGDAHFLVLLLPICVV